MDYALTPTSIHRKLAGKGPEIVDVETPDGDRENARSQLVIPRLEYRQEK